MTVLRSEKEVLMCHALGINRVRLLSHPELFDRKNPKYLELLQRRENNEPVAYIVGHQPFMGLNILVDRSTLIPRPETEELVELAIKTIALGGSRITHYEILDIGTGSGCISLALASKIKNAAATGVDRSAKALAVACKNAEINGLSGKVRFIERDLFGAVDRKYDLIISNPPYIPSGDIPGLMPDVRNWEPKEALDGGMDGLDHIRKIIAGSGERLKKDGFLLMEFGFGQTEAIEAIARKHFNQIKISKDLAGIDRFLYASA
ncbi:MAG TPA: peptide chain release factor N(5)-glutamine methyltransferase [Candidatus Omnitrophota bacterium]|nr:peptide chain release factor N(5)-glutamine methyltransferase [Candidatus Omnitrophota bacterium]